MKEIKEMKEMKRMILVLLFFFTSNVSAITTDELVRIHTLTTAEKTALSTPIADGTLVFDKMAKKLYVYADSDWEELLFTPKVFVKTGDYTLALSDNGSILTFNNSSAITLTIPSGFPIGYNVSIYQIGTGKVTIVGSGTTVLNRLNRFKTAGKDAGVGIVSTATNTYHITGDLKK